MRFILSWAVFIILFLTACQEKTTSDNIQSVQTDGPIMSIIRNPVTANNRDTVNVAKMEFAEREFHFGHVDEGAKVKHRFAFTNTGKVPLLITGAKSTCGCTVPSYPEEFIAPGEGGEIEVVFDTNGKKAFQSKTVTVTANTYPSINEVVLKGHVDSKPDTGK